MDRRSRVGLLLGGPSSEREVSFKSGKACAEALRRKGYDVVEIDVGPKLAADLTREKVEVAFNILHGKWGEDGCVQGLLEVMGIPYTGAGVTASAVAMDKILSKLIFADAGIPIAPHIVITQGNIPDRIDMEFPVVVKPATEGSSVGISIVTKPEDFRDAAKIALKDDKRALVEKYIRGRDIQAAVLNGEAIGIVEVRPRPVEGEKISFYDFKHKYTKGMTEYLTKPEDFSGDARKKIEMYSVRACEVLGAEGAARIDFMVDASDQPFILEVNTLPGMTELSLFPMIARDWAGLSFDDLVERILLSARLKMGA
jgi:D-alanine-D-alanine ligase